MMEMPMLMAIMPVLMLALVVLACFLFIAYGKARLVPRFSVVGMLLALITLLGCSMVGNSANAQGTFFIHFPPSVNLSAHLVVDGFARLHIALVLFAGLVALFFQRVSTQTHHNAVAVAHISTVLMVLGASVSILSNGLLALALGMELLSMATLGLVFSSGMAKERDDMQKAVALTRVAFIRHAVSICVFLFGFALLFAHSGSITYSDINRALLYDTEDPLLLIGSVLILFSFIYQMAFFPLQGWFSTLQNQVNKTVWLPILLVSVYALCISFVRFLVATAVPVVPEVTVTLTLICLILLVAASIQLLVQTCVNRFLCYLMMVQMGLTLVVMLALGHGSVMVVNLLMMSNMLGMLLASVALQGMHVAKVTEDTTLAYEVKPKAHALIGCYYEHGKLTWLLCLGLLTLVGLPMTLGFFAKLFVVMATIQGLDWFLTLVVILVTGMMWVGVAKRLYGFFQKPNEVEVSEEHSPLSYPMKLVCAVLLVCVLGCGVYPDLLLQLAKLAIMS